MPLLATIMTKLGHRDNPVIHARAENEDSLRRHGRPQNPATRRIGTRKTVHTKITRFRSHGNLESEKPMGCNGMQWNRKEKR